jgi:inorganic pyrophosphatase
MVISNFLKTAEKFEIQAYKRPKNHKELRKTHVAFSGSPQKHPFDSYRVILVTDPYSTNTMYYEFMKKDISYVEELPNLVGLDGDTVLMVRIWVKKRSIAVRSSAFIVDDTMVL